MKMTIAKLLQYKKRVVQRLSKIDADITRNNSTLSANETEADINSLLIERSKLMPHLVDLKTTLTQINIENDIQRKIYQLSELKSQCAFLQSIPTKHGKHAGEYGGEVQEYKATIRQSELESMIKLIETEIDKLQEELDVFAHTKTVEIETQV